MSKPYFRCNNRRVKQFLSLGTNKGTLDREYAKVMNSNFGQTHPIYVFKNTSRNQDAYNCKLHAHGRKPNNLSNGLSDFTST